MEKARAAGTSQAVLNKVSKPEFLQKCLRRAKLDADLVQDVVDACDMNELTALVLGSGELSDSEAEEKLFLMQDEARSILNICKCECLKAGVNFGDGSVYEPVEGEEEDESDEEEAPPALAAASPISAPAEPSSDPVKPVEDPLPSAKNLSISAVSAPAADEHADPLKSPVVIKPPAQFPSPKQAGKSPVPAKTSGAATTPAVPKSNPRPASSVSRSAASTEAGAGAASTPSTTAMSAYSRPASAAPKVASSRVPAATKTPPSATSGVKAKAAKEKESEKKSRPASAPPKATPSYARPTMAQKIRTEGAPEEPSPSPAGTPEPSSSARKETLPPPKKAFSPALKVEKPRPERKSMFDNISSSLLRPTKAFLAWAGGKKEDGAGGGAAAGPETRALTPKSSGSQRLRTSSARGTGGGAFSMGPGLVGGSSRTMSTSASKIPSIAEMKAARAAGKPLTSEEMQMLKAHEETGGSFKARPAPKSMARRESAGTAANGTQPPQPPGCARIGSAPVSASKQAPSASNSTDPNGGVVVSQEKKTPLTNGNASVEASAGAVETAAEVKTVETVAEIKAVEAKTVAAAEAAAVVDVDASNPVARAIEAAASPVGTS